MNSSHRSATTSPVHWSALPTPGAWVKELLAAERPGGDAFSLLRLAPGGTATVPISDLDRVLVLAGPVEVPGSGRHHRGDYLAPTPASVDLHAPDGEAVLLRLTGPDLGDPVRDVFGPAGWFAASPGLWAKLLLPMPAAPDEFDERLVGLSYLEPGAASDRHPHPTAHRFLFLDGEADDEVVFPDGRRDLVTRRAGDFVDYPTGVEHRTHSRTGCLILFVHEARSVGATP